MNEETSPSDLQTVGFLALKNATLIAETFGFHQDSSARIPIRIAMAMAEVPTPKFLPISTAFLLCPPYVPHLLLQPLYTSFLHIQQILSSPRSPSVQHVFYLFDVPFPGGPDACQLCWESVRVMNFKENAQ